MVQFKVWETVHSLHCWGLHAFRRFDKALNDINLVHEHPREPEVSRYIGLAQVCRTMNIDDTTHAGLGIPVYIINLIKSIHRITRHIAHMPMSLGQKFARKEAFV